MAAERRYLGLDFLVEDIDFLPEGVTADDVVQTLKDDLNAWLVDWHDAKGHRYMQSAPGSPNAEANDAG